jgi:ABC-type multidrug transport system fused ATPase/permease subunit
MHLKTLPLLRSVYCILSPQRKRQLFLLLWISILSSTLEISSIVFAVRLIEFALDPSSMFASRFYPALESILGSSDPVVIVKILGTFFVCFALFAAFARIFTLWYEQKLASWIGSDLSCGIFRNLISQSYEFHLDSNSSSFINAIGPQVIRSVLAINAALSAGSGLAFSTLLISYLILKEPLYGLSMLLLLSIAYIALAVKLRPIVKRNSFTIAESERLLLRSLQEALGSIRDLILDKSQKYFMAMYSKVDISLRRKRSENLFIMSFPRYAFDFLFMAFIGLAVIFVNGDRGDSFVRTSSLGFVLFAYIRLMPSLQQIFSAVGSIASYSADLREVVSLYGAGNLDDALPTSIDSSQLPLAFFNRIQLNNISFSYGNSFQAVLSGVSFSIPKGSVVGIVGRSGSGKSTLVDIIMGLLMPTSGSVLLDDAVVVAAHRQANLDGWRSMISHVPQSVYLVDSSIVENIALGVRKCDIDMSRIWDACDKAQLTDFIRSLDNGLNTFVGERGVKLSGGQRQRIGIARALYKRSSILVLDEATSALDEETEGYFVDTVNRLRDSLTIIIVAHRMATLQKCDSIIKLHDGCARQVSAREFFATM